MSGSRWSKRDRERHVSQLFCRSLGDAYELNSQFSESPDFLIDGPDGQIGLELTQYRNPGPENEVEEFNRDFQSFFLDQWIDDETVHHWHVSLFHRRGLSRSGKRYVAFPRSARQKQDVIDELKTLVRGLKAPKDAPSVWIHFDGRPACRPHANHDVCWIQVGPETYPRLARYYRRICLGYGAPAVFGLPTSDLNCGAVGIDPDVLLALFERKMKKLQRYRENIRGQPIWLLIYNEGHTISRNVGPRSKEVIVPLIQEAHLQSQESFDAIWWGEDCMLQEPFSSDFFRIV